MCSLRGPLLVLGRGCALVFGRGAEVLGRYVCSTRASSFLPFLIKFLEASLEFWFAFELVFPDLDSAQELAFSSHLLSFLGFPQHEPMNLFSDNKPAVNAVLTSNTTPLTKHLDAHYHYVQELNVTKIIKAKWIERKFNESDIFT